MNRHADGEQFAFDIDELIRAERIENAPPWTGAPLGFTTDYWSPEQLDAAVDHWQFLHSGSDARPRSHMWHRSVCAPRGIELAEHRIDVFDVDLRCPPSNHNRGRRPCACIGDLTYLAICEPCGWHAIGIGENAVVEAWHDHALPSWRELPVVPEKVNRRDHRGFSKATKKWIADHYPAEAQVPGAPIITARSAFGTRHVPGRSPWGGYDLSDSALQQTQPSNRRGPDPDPERRPPARVEGRGLGD